MLLGNDVCLLPPPLEKGDDMRGRLRFFLCIYKIKTKKEYTLYIYTTTKKKKMTKNTKSKISCFLSSFFF